MAETTTTIDKTSSTISYKLGYIPKYRGTWSTGTTYYPGNIVKSENGSACYICKRSDGSITSTVSPEEDTTNWDILAKDTSIQSVNGITLPYNLGTKTPNETTGVITLPELPITINGNSPAEGTLDISIPVPVSTGNTPSEDDLNTDVTTTSWVNNKLQDYISTDGGTLNNELTVHNRYLGDVDTFCIAGDDPTKSLEIHNYHNHGTMGTEEEKLKAGPFINLIGSQVKENHSYDESGNITITDQSNFAGTFALTAYNPNKYTDKYTLRGYPNGMLTWNGGIRTPSKTLGSYDQDTVSLYGVSSSGELCLAASKNTLSYTDGNNVTYPLLLGAQLYLHGYNATTKTDFDSNGNPQVSELDSDDCGPGGFYLAACKLNSAGTGRDTYGLYGSATSGQLQWTGHIKVRSKIYGTYEHSKISIHGSSDTRELGLAATDTHAWINSTDGDQLLGGQIYLHGYKVATAYNSSDSTGTSYTSTSVNDLYRGSVSIVATGRALNSTTTGFLRKDLIVCRDGTLTWNGQAMSVTSDETKKQNIKDVTEEVLLAWKDVNWTSFKYKEAVTAKGDNARKHTGLIAQQIIKAFEAHHLNACDWGLICKVNNNGSSLWSVRYEEALAMEAAYQRYRADRLEERIAKLEAKLA